MFFTSAEYGDAERGKRETRGLFEFLENCIGIFSTTHSQQGRFLDGRIEIRFRGADGVAMTGLNDPDIARALGFRGDVNVAWGDRTSDHDVDPFDHYISIDYKSETLGERTDYEDLRRAAQLDLAAIDAFLDCAIYEAPAATPPPRSGAAFSYPEIKISPSTARVLGD
ncbi:MAG: hypothetical protein UY75_C0028G0002 [Parcubacteria group bacterium GW2011_GWC2_52_8c]|nr:MAG: hypothetical protein UY75_C0028G0002 [Parcubacteria group bacterium GW2011_GWC2_52_8c]